MNILDCIVLALSILAVFAVGVLSGRRSRASASEGEFLMANKSLNKLQTGFSTAATDFGGSGMVGAIGYCYLVGMSGIWWNLTAAPPFSLSDFCSPRRSTAWTARLCRTIWESGILPP